MVSVESGATVSPSSTAFVAVPKAARADAVSIASPSSSGVSGSGVTPRLPNAEARLPAGCC